MGWKFKIFLGDSEIGEWIPSERPPVDEFLVTCKDVKDLVELEEENESNI